MLQPLLNKIFLCGRLFVPLVFAESSDVSVSYELPRVVPTGPEFLDIHHAEEVYSNMSLVRFSMNPRVVLVCAVLYCWSHNLSW